MKKQTLAKLLVLCLMLTMVLPVSAFAANTSLTWTKDGSSNKYTIQATDDYTLTGDVTVGVKDVKATYELSMDAHVLTVNAQNGASGDLGYIIVNDANALSINYKETSASAKNPNLKINGFKLMGSGTKGAELNLEYAVNNDTVYFVGADTKAPTKANVTIKGGSFAKIIVGAGVYAVTDDTVKLTNVEVKDGGKCVYFDGSKFVTLPKPDDSNNPVGPGGNSGGTPGGSPGTTPTPSTDKTVTETLKPTTDADGSATAEVSKTEGDKIVQEAVKNNAENINLKVDSTADKATVNLPTDVAQNIVDKTDAAVNVVTSNATVTIPNSALDKLAGEADNTVGVTVEKKADNTVTISVTADGEPVSSVAGIKATVDGGEKAGVGTVVVIVNEDGTETIVKKSMVDKDGNITAPLTGGVTTLKVIEDNSIPFTDTASVESWAGESIDFVSSRQLFKGVSDTEFAPNSNMSRAMLATVLYRLEDAVASGNGGFADVPSGEWYTEAVGWASEQGIVNGTGNGFEPDGNITRQDMATMIYRYARSLGMDTSVSSGAMDSFTDSGSVAGYASDAMSWAISKGIINGMGDGTLNPTGSATRAQVSAILMRLVEIM